MTMDLPATTMAAAGGRHGYRSLFGQRGYIVPHRASAAARAGPAQAAGPARAGPAQAAGR